MADEPQVEPKRSRRSASIVSCILMTSGAVLFGFSRFFAVEGVESGLVFFLVAVSLTLVIVGLVVGLKFAGKGKGSGEGFSGFVKKCLVLGFSLVGLGVVMLLAIVIVAPYENAELPLLFSVGLISIGLVVVSIGAGSNRMNMMRRRFAIPQSIMDSFQEIEPEKTLETKDFKVLKKGNIYILLPKLFNVAFFVRLFNQAPSREHKVRLRIRLLRKKYFKDEICGLPVAKVRGEFIIPIDVIKRSEENIEEKYVKGRGISYVVPRYDIPQRKRLVAPDISEKFDKDTILKIIDELSKESIENRISR